jgi:hypothetical protein
MSWQITSLCKFFSQNEQMPDHSALPSESLQSALKMSSFHAAAPQESFWLNPQAEQKRPTTDPPHSSTDSGNPTKKRKSTSKVI